MKSQTRTHGNRLRDERGIALIVALLVAVAVAAISVGAALLATNAAAINRYSERLSVLESSALSGIEEVRSMVNGDKTLYPDSLYNTIENGASVYDATGLQIPNVTRWLYVGPTGVTTGQYGVFGSIVAVVEDAYGNRLVRRGEVTQESFAKYAYFTTIEGNIWFAGGDQIWGPVHSNDRVQIHSTGATFHSSVTTAKDVYQPQYGTFMQGYTEYAPVIPMPQTADLVKLKVQGQVGSTAFIGNSAGGHGEATTRIEFIAVDLNGDNDSTDADEGFFRIYQQLANPEWVSGDIPPGGSLETTPNCGDFHAGTFVQATDHPGTWGHSALAAVTNPTRRCYLGGADSIWGGAFNAGPDPEGGRWLPWPGAVSPAVAAKRPDDAGYLFPITRTMNPSFRGVIYVEGKVVISGVVRGKVTVAATDDIVIGDDVRYATDPGAGTCSDMLGIFSGNDIVIADNTLNAPVLVGGTYRTYDETSSEFIHGVVLALNVFTAENYSSGSTNAEPCQGTPWGRGCIFLTGGIIQRQRGAVGLTSGQGYIKRYSFDQCASGEPPPYFPTTGHFARGRIFEVDPTNFDVAQYYRMLTP